MAGIGEQTGDWTGRIENAGIPVAKSPWHQERSRAHLGDGGGPGSGGLTRHSPRTMMRGDRGGPGSGRFLPGNADQEDHMSV